MITKQDLLDLGFIYIGELTTISILFKHPKQKYGAIMFHIGKSSIGKIISSVRVEETTDYFLDNNLTVEELATFDNIFIETPEELKDFLNKHFFKTPL